MAIQSTSGTRGAHPVRRTQHRIGARHLGFALDSGKRQDLAKRGLRHAETLPRRRLD